MTTPITQPISAEFVRSNHEETAHELIKQPARPYEGFLLLLNKTLYQENTGPYAEQYGLTDKVWAFVPSKPSQKDVNVAVDSDSIENFVKDVKGAENSVVMSQVIMKVASNVFQFANDEHGREIASKRDETVKSTLESGGSVRDLRDFFPEGFVEIVAGVEDSTGRVKVHGLIDQLVNFDYDAGFYGKAMTLYGKAMTLKFSKMIEDLPTSPGVSDTEEVTDKEDVSDEEVSDTEDFSYEENSDRSIPKDESIITEPSSPPLKEKELEEITPIFVLPIVPQTSKPLRHPSAPLNAKKKRGLKRSVSKVNSNGTIKISFARNSLISALIANPVLESTGKQFFGEIVSRTKMDTPFSETSKAVHDSLVIAAGGDPALHAIGNLRFNPAGITGEVINPQ